MDDIFRLFFGSNRPRSDRPVMGDRGDDDDDDMEGFFFGGDNRDLFGTSFFHFNDHIQRQMDAMTRQMEEMFKNFGAVQFPSEFDQQHGSFAPTSPRNQMLKDLEPGVPEQGPSQEIVPIQPPKITPHRFGKFPGLFRGDSHEKKDTDLDGQIQGSDDVGKLFDREKIVPHVPGPSAPQMPFMWSKGFSRSFSRTFRNGHMEEVETIQHSDGSTEKIVTQRQGDKTHTITYRTDKDGHTEKSETFKNMDESDLPSLNESLPEGRKPMIKDPSSAPSVPGISQDDKSFFSKLFGFDFWKSK